MRFKIDWARLIVRSKFTVFALFCFVFEGNFPSTSTRGAYIWRGDLTESFLRYWFGGLIHGGAYFSELYGILLINRNIKAFPVFSEALNFIIFFNFWHSLSSSLTCYARASPTNPKYAPRFLITAVDM